MDELLHFADHLADASGSAIRPYFRQPFLADDKSGGTNFDPVTAADREAEAAIRSLIEERYPDHGIFGEELGFRPGSAGLTWVIDPIDGTKAFVTGMPLGGTLIAVYNGQVPILGIMDQPYLGERFIGSRFGARMRLAASEYTLRVRRCAGLEQAFLQCTHPDMFETRAEAAAFAALRTRTRLTRYSGDCYAYCMLAHGLIDLVVETGLKPYDIQAVIPIIEAAGGVVSDWRGGNPARGGQVIAAGDSRLHREALGILSSAAGELDK